MAIVITKEMIKAANDYVSLADKDAMTRYMALACIENADPESMPYIVERRALKQQYLMGILAKLYLKQDYTQQKSVITDGEKEEQGELDCCMDVESYDEWASSHVFNQLVRFKKDKEVADKVFDMMEDFRLFEIMLSKAITELCDRGNDNMNKLQTIIDTLAKSEKLKELTDMLEAMNTKPKRAKKVKTDA